MNTTGTTSALGRTHLKPGRRTTLVRWTRVGDDWVSDTFDGIYEGIETRDGERYYVMAGSFEHVGFKITEWTPCIE